MKNLATPHVWLLCGSQDLYGPGPLQEVAGNASAVTNSLNESGRVSLPIKFAGLLTTADEITRAVLKANADPDCAGLILWMHTFSPAKMWIGGLSRLSKPFLHLHTQFNKNLPWADIDMDFMNLNQAAHGDREAGFLHTRLRLERKVVVGHWSEPGVQEQVGAWTRAARAWHDLQGARIARFGDNMRNVAVTEGDKVAAELRFGFTVLGYGVGDLVEVVNAIPESAVENLLGEYDRAYTLTPEARAGGSKREAVRYEARVELGLRSFLEAGDFKGFTTSFEDLHGLKQLPGLAVQRLMADGYGFGPEGDWKTSALLRAVKVMGEGRPGGASLMEDYTYHLGDDGARVLGAHMLEVDPSIAAAKPVLDVQPLGIGGKSDPVRLVFDAAPGEALNASLIDMGNRFRLVVNTVNVVTHPPLPRLPVAAAVWEPRPDFRTAATAWILAGGAHHSAFTSAAGVEELEDFASMANIELVIIDADTKLRPFKAELRNNDLYYSLAQGLRN